MKIWAFLLLSMLAGAASEDLDKRVASGFKKCETSERKYHVFLQSTKSICGGSLINTRWVITAARCGGLGLKVQLGIHSSFGSKVKGFFKGIKNLFKGKDGDSQQQEIPVGQQFGYNEEEKKLDVMLVKLNVDVPKLETIALPPVGCSRPTGDARVASWGAKTAKMHGEIPKNTGAVYCTATSVAACKELKEKGGYQYDDTNTICGFKPGVDACLGDAGGGLESGGLLHGVLSTEAGDKCTPEMEFVDVCVVREWIDKTMREHA